MISSCNWSFKPEAQICRIHTGDVWLFPTYNFWNFVIWRVTIDAMLIFVLSYFQFCLRAEDAMVARFSFVIKGMKETLEWFQ